jgi:hypothetical protein
MSGRSLTEMSLDELARLGEKAEVGSPDKRICLPLVSCNVR